MMSIKKIVAYGFVALIIVLAVQSLGYSQQLTIDDVEVEEFRKTIEKVNKQRMQRIKENPKLAKEWAEAVKKANEPQKTPQNEKKEQICLDGGVCVNADFKWGLPATEFIRICDAYISNKNKQTDESLYCKAYLKGFNSAIFIDEVIRQRMHKKPSVICHTPKAGGAKQFVRKIIEYLDTHPEMEEMNIGYVIYKIRMDDENSICANDTK